MERVKYAVMAAMNNGRFERIVAKTFFSKVLTPNVIAKLIRKQPVQTTVDNLRSPYPYTDFKVDIGTFTLLFSYDSTGLGGTLYVVSVYTPLDDEKYAIDLNTYTLEEIYDNPPPYEDPL